MTEKIQSKENQGTGSGVLEDVHVDRKRSRPRKGENQGLGSSLLGWPVFAVIDLTFEAILTARVGDSDETFKGVLFNPRSTVPVSESNDVAPHLEMLRRCEVQSLQLNPREKQNISEASQ